MFSGFTNNHFEAYRPDKWRSKAFNLERMAVKEQLGALALALQGRLTLAGGAPLEAELSAEYPEVWNQKQVKAQHLYFARPAGARREIERVVDRARGLASLIEDPSPQRSHVFLTASVFVDHLYIGLKLHRDASVDRRNLEKQLGDAMRAQELLAQLQQLPGDIQIGIDSHADQPASRCSLEHLSAFVDRLNAPLSPGQSRWLTMGKRMERDNVIALGHDLADHIERVLTVLLPIYHYVAWSRDNDHIGMSDELRERKAAALQRGLSKNDSVRVITGMFAGRTGRVQEIDKKGMVKVLIGSVPLRLKAEDVVKQ